jgi:hypothetical protein
MVSWESWENVGNRERMGNVREEDLLTCNSRQVFVGMGDHDGQKNTGLKGLKNHFVRIEMSEKWGRGGGLEGDRWG